MKRNGSKHPLCYTVLIEQDEAGWYIAKVPAVKGCHTQARNIPELLRRAKEAIEVCLEAEGRAPRPLRFVGVQQIEIPA